jgi:hypothetical protein
MQPWISTKEMPAFDRKEWQRLYLITDGKQVYAAHLSDNDIHGTYFYALGLPIEVAKGCTHWMEADRLLVFLGGYDGLER